MKRSVAIIGGGPAALMLAATLDETKFDITIHEKKASTGRKFLVAGDGGFNLTHSENIDEFISRYTPSSFLEDCLRHFSNDDLRKWLEKNGIPTFIGSSKRVFPIKGIKPIELLNTFLKVLDRKGVVIKTRHEWKGWNERGELILGDSEIKPAITVFALGGSSWKKTGSDGNWTKFFEEKNIGTIPFQASNCGYEIKWKKGFVSQWQGKSLKNISLYCANKKKSGEVVITKFGLEGGAIYALSPEIRSQLSKQTPAPVFLDLKPTLDLKEINARLNKKGPGSLTDRIKKELNLDALSVALLKSILSKEEFVDISVVSEKIKKLPMEIISTAPIDEAISTVGGISREEIDKHFQLKKLPENYVIGEMLDWDAPTGGYLLQACFSMGHQVATILNAL